MVLRKSTSSQTVYQLKITLKDAKPPIWRRVQVLNDMSLQQLHHLIQLVMGWTDSHLHQFTIAGIEYGQPMPDYEFDVRNEVPVKLNKVISGEKFKFLYTYDMGDSAKPVSVPAPSKKRRRLLWLDSKRSKSK